MWSEIKRKVFHLTGFIYVAGLIYLPRPRYLAILGGLLIVEGLVEYARLRSPRFHVWMVAHFGGLFRAKEATQFTGTFWMMAGALVTGWLLSPVSIAVTAMLYILIGDTVASLVGKRIGRVKWPNSPKSVVGSAACLISCLSIGATLLRPDYGWAGIVIGAVVATAVEFKFPVVDDNFSMPVVSALALMFCYKLTPVFW